MEGGLHITLAPYVLGELWGIPITSTLISTLFASAVLLITAFLIGRNLKLVPGKVQVFVETLLLGVRDYMEEVLEDKKQADRFFPLIITLFLFILFANLLGLLPFTGEVGIIAEDHGKETLLPFFYPVNTDLNVTLALAVVAFISIEFAGITTLGFLRYAGKFVNFKSVIGFFVGLMELVSEVARLITYSFRLFGNIFAGKVLLLLALAFFPYILPLPLLVYETFVGVIQAAVFAVLTLFFIKIAVAEPH